MKLKAGNAKTVPNTDGIRQIPNTGKKKSSERDNSFGRDTSRPYRK